MFLNTASDVDLLQINNNISDSTDPYGDVKIIIKGFTEMKTDITHTLFIFFVQFLIMINEATIHHNICQRVLSCIMSSYI